MAKHKHKTLHRAGMTERRLVYMIKMGLLRYDREADSFWTLSPPSSWSKEMRGWWKKPAHIKGIDGRLQVQIPRCNGKS